MSAEYSITLDDVSDYLEALPSRLGVWRTTPRGEHWPLLGWLNVWPVQELRHTAVQVGLPLAAAMRHTELYNAVGVAVSWAERYLTETSAEARSEELERRGLIRRATDAWMLRDLLRSAQAGVYVFASNGNHLHFRFTGDADLEALDNLLDTAYEMMQTQTLRSQLYGEDGSETVPFDQFRSYVMSHDASLPWEQADGEVRDGFRLYAAKMVEGMRRVSAPPSLRLGDFTLGDALAVWKELLAGALYRHFCLLLGSCHPLIAAPLRRREELVAELAPCGLDRSVIHEVVRFLTFYPDRDEDPCLAPLIPVGECVVPMSSLIAPSSPERNILARVRADPSSFGAIGQEIGRIGPATVGEALRRVRRSRVVTEVKVRNDGGLTLGDLDVVAIDEADKLVAVFEVKWQLEPDGAKELDKAEAQAREGQVQMARLRHLVESGEVSIRWPADWPTLDGFEWRWFVITSNVIPVTRIADDDMPARSHRVLTMMALRDRATLREVCDIFTDPPLPQAGKQYLLETRTHRIGPYTITVEAPS